MISFNRGKPSYSPLVGWPAEYLQDSELADLDGQKCTFLADVVIDFVDIFDNDSMWLAWDELFATPCI